MAIHKQNRIFCTHASLTKVFSPGVGSLNRFSWYPGNPLLQLFKVEKLHLFALSALHSSEINELRAALIPLLVATGLFSYGIDCHPIDITLAFLMATPTGALWSLLMLVLNSSSADAAVWVYKRFIRGSMLRYEGNLFGVASQESTNTIPLWDNSPPHEIPVPTDDFETGDGSGNRPFPGQSSTSMTRTPFFSASTVAALEAGLNASQPN
jgi:hypothetical protein